MNFIIEGTVSEITVTKDKYSLKIQGTDGYFLKKKNGSESVNVNVLCSCTEGKKNKFVGNNKVPSHSLKVPQDFEYNFSEKYLSLCTAALTNGKKMRFVFEELESPDDEKIPTEIDEKNYWISFITLLAD